MKVAEKVLKKDSEIDCNRIAKLKPELEFSARNFKTDLLIINWCLMSNNSCGSKVKIKNPDPTQKFFCFKSFNLPVNKMVIKIIAGIKIPKFISKLKKSPPKKKLPATHFNFPVSR